MAVGSASPLTAQSLRAVFVTMCLFFPQSMQVHAAYVTNDGPVCLDIAGQIALGGMSASRVVYLTEAWPHRGKGKGK